LQALRGIRQGFRRDLFSPLLVVIFELSNTQKMIIQVKENNIYIYGYIYQGDGTYFLNEFSKIDGTFPEIEVFIHCYGGVCI
jgi:hypothetical protein